MNQNPHPRLAKLIRVFVAIVIIVIVLVTVAQQAGRFGPWWLELSRYVPYPAVLVPAIIAVLSSWWLGRWWLVASVVALALVVTAAMGFEWHDGDRGDTHVRLVTYNIKAYKARWRPGGFAEIGWEVALHDPDILVMQDADGLLGDRDESKPVVVPVFGLRNVYAMGEYVVASRLPLRECGVDVMSRLGTQKYTYVHCIVQANGVDLHLVTAHFQSPRSGLNAARHEAIGGIDEWRENYEQRRLQASGLLRDLAGSARPLIVAGDLNAPESSPVIGTLLSIGLRDAFSSAGRGYGFSYGQALRVGFSFLRIDHVLVSPEIGVADCFVGDGSASDHRPVITDLLLHRQ